MSIDINGLNSRPLAPATERGNPAEEAREPVGRSDESTPSSVRDTVSFSDTAVRLGKLGVAVDDTPVVDTERVERVKQAVMDGTYNVDPTRIAEKMMDLELALKPDQ